MIYLVDALSSYRDDRYRADLGLLPPARREKALR